MIDSDNYDWSTFRITYYYNAHIIRVFRTWTQSAGLESFLITRGVYTSKQNTVRDDDESPAKGDHYHWQFRSNLEVSGDITQYIEKQKFAFTLGDMQVDLNFSVLGDQTEVELIQSNIPVTNEGKVSEHLNWHSRWIFFMTNLSSVLDYGNDLRDENVNLTASMELGFTPATLLNKK